MTKPVEIDYEILAHRCSMAQEEFMSLEGAETYPVLRQGYTSYYTKTNQKTGESTKVETVHPDEHSFYIFKDNGAKILAVAHLDTVIDTQENWTFQTATLGRNRDKYTKTWNAQLDDRLGVYIILDLLPQFLGNNAYDILLTTDEESSNSTAADFVLPEGKNYNWIFQFDRRGTGAVLYGYESQAWRDTVHEFLPVTSGTYSDICKLYHLGVKALNVGTGYHDEHMDLCYMLEHEVKLQVARFVRFFRQYKDTRFPHDPNVTSGWSRWNGAWADDEDYGNWWDGRSDTGYANFRRLPDGTSSATAVQRFPPTSPLPSGATYPSPLVTGMPRNTGMVRHVGENEIEEEDDGETRPIDTTYERDFAADANDKLMMRSVLQTMKNYDKHGNYIRDDLNALDFNLIKSSDYYDTDVSRWITLPAVTKINTLYQFQTATDGMVIPPTLVPVYYNRVSNSKAVCCKHCTTFDFIDNMFWTPDCVPLCMLCLDILPQGTVVESSPPAIIGETEDGAYEIPLDDDLIRWLQEGGGVRLHEKRNVRSFVGVDMRIEHCYCDMCSGAEWRDKLLTFTNEIFAEGESAEICRICFEEYQDANAGEDSPF